MRGFCILLGAICLTAMLAPTAIAHQIALKSGRVIQFEKYKVTEELLLYTDEAGKEVRIALADIDLDRTGELSAGDNPPLDLPGIHRPNPKQTDTTNQPALGDVARKNRPRDAQTTAKRVWTSDDFSSAGAGGSVSMPTDPNQLEILHLSCDALARSVLRSVAPELDVSFPERGEWERDLCRVRNEWHDQYLRYESHKGTSTEIDEREKAADWWQILHGISSVGPAKARLYLEKQGARR